MLKSRISSVSTWIFLVALAAGLQAAAPNFLGTWLGKTEVPDAGLDELTLVIAENETGFTGKVSDSLEIIAPNTEVKDIAIKDNEITFSFFLADGAMVKIKMKIDGDIMTGAWEHEQGDTGTLEFARKKA